MKDREIKLLKSNKVSVSPSSVQFKKQLGSIDDIQTNDSMLIDQNEEMTPKPVNQSNIEIQEIQPPTIHSEDWGLILSPKYHPEDKWKT